MPHRIYRTPGVYVKEIGLLPPSIEPIRTAVPAFIGYTPRCETHGKPYRYEPTKIASLQEFVRIFGRAHDPEENGSSRPSFHLKPGSSPSSVDLINLHGSTHSILPDAGTIYYLFDSLRLFYDNGGGDAYIVSTGPYGKPDGAPATDPRSIVNRNVRLSELQTGLAALESKTEPTLTLCPDAALLSPTENASLMQSMLQQNARTLSAVSILDVSEGRAPESSSYLNGIAAYRSRVGNQNLSFGLAYYPFLQANVVRADEIDARNLFGGDPSLLEPVLSPPHRPNRDAAKLLGLMTRSSRDPDLLREYDQKLESASDAYRQIKAGVREAANRLPPSGAIAGAIVKTDQRRGVWKAPANIALTSVSGVTINLSSSQQAPLNIDPQGGKSINAIRAFSWRGTLVWGARTLAGNDPELRYIPARRTLLFIEQSVDRGLQPFVFKPNDASTWSSIRNAIEAFLRDLWRDGAFAGYTERDAFSVRCGLGSTMTAADISAHRIRIQIAVALQRPAEFSIISLSLNLRSAP
ncbi:phage tail sheath C-terminal domain-containing protein [Pelagicoccus sp. SDUM812003]|uniref:phage tail sheath family protein n=1 Tax=Pelagicoccus sp. SDUM812003 TaxID=3041267 RepID=UPI0028107C67|nr:phage tail sheath C-terminal domain-containing protein [Pelagicoccus sp. SDUM812003]MDQ8205669.1 phage tail sheath C-terminal domain-containing protein [Pelagicoccus sp. SDUM812003]